MKNTKSIDRLSPAERRALLENALREKARRTEPRIIPLTFGQRALWFIDRIAPESAAYITPLSLRIRSEVDVGALRRAAQTLLSRHLSLRTTFTQRDGEPVAVVRSDLEVDFDLVDAEAWSEADATARLIADLHRPFDLEKGPLFRLLLLRRAPKEHLLLFTAHHIVTDLWSVVIMVEELGALYAAETRGEPLRLPSPTHEYDAYVRHEAELVASPDGTRMLDFWRKRLGGELPNLELPADHRRPKVVTFRGNTEDFRLDEALTRRLRSLAKQEETTLNTVLLAAFYVVLHRSSGQEDIVVGSPTSGRDRPEFAETVGYFVNPIPLRADLSGEPSFRSFLRQVRATMLGAIEHQTYPFPLLVENIHPERDTSRSPIFQAVFVLQQLQRLEGTFAALMGASSARATIGGLECEALSLPRYSSQFDVELMMIESEGALWGSLQYATDLFEPETMRRMVEHFRILLEGIVEDPDRSLSSLPFLTKHEQRALLVDYNATASPFPSELCLHQMFERRAVEAPDATAVVAAGARISYGALDARANQLAHRLVALGVGPEVPVAVCVERGIDMVVAVMGVLKAGGAYVSLDPAYPHDRLLYMLEHAKAPILVSEERFARSFEDASSGTWSGARVVCLDRDAAVLAGEPTTSPRTTVESTNLAYIIYTSGSTGRPKGVAIEHRSAVNTIWDMNERFGVGPDDRVLALSSLSFDLSVYDVFGLLAAGGAIVIPEPASAREPSHWAELAARENVTVWNTVPALMDMLVEHAKPRPGAFPRSLRVVWMSGDFIPLKLPDAIRALSPATRVISLGGATEGSIWSIIFPIEAVDPEWESIPYGAPMRNQTYYVLNEALEPCALGVPGMLYIGGVGVARGYWRDEEKTAASFLVHPRTGERLYRTGDLGRYRSEALIEILGRADTQVKIRGYRIELGEIEAVLAKHPALSGAVVEALADATPARGRRERRLVAYVKAPEATAPTADELRAHVRAHLPEYMVPSVFVRLDAFPLSDNGKVQRKALPRPPDARVEGAAAKDPAAQPTSHIEAVLASIWGELLGLDHVGVDENFFDLGGHSLLVARVQSRIKEALDREVRIVELFEHSTIRALARHLDPSSAKGVATEEEGARLRREALGRRLARAGDDRIAIVGVSGRFPGARDVAALWQNLHDGKEGIRFFTDEELAAAGIPEAHRKDPTYVKAYGVLDDADSFDPGFFGYTPRDAAQMDPQHGLLLECAEEALENAGYDPLTYAGRIGVWAGAGMPGYFLPAVAAGEVSDLFGLMLGHDKDFLTTRVSYKLNLRGPSVVVQTACSTSLVAVHLACRSLLDGECDMALAGGVSLKFPQVEGYFFVEGSIASPDGHCRAFDARARGTVGGSGVGLVVLKRLDDALRDRDTIHAVIRGSAINNDGSSKVSYTAPSVDRQAEVIAEAHAAAGIEPESLGYVEAHGTGTELGDPIEIAALTRAFGGAAAGSRTCAIGSIKTNVGHLNTAAGIAGLIKVVSALEHRQIPPTLHFEAPNPVIDFSAGPFFVNTALADWPERGTPRRAAVSSFGIGGTNAHVVLEEAPARPAPAPARRLQVLTLSARTEAALDRATTDLAAHLARHPEQALADVAYTLHVGRRAFAHRRVLVCGDADDVASVLGDPTSKKVLTGESGAAAPGVAFLLPGQGSQYPDMGLELYREEPAFQEVIDRGCDLLSTRFGLALRDILYGGKDAAEALRRTSHAQPALFLTSYAMATVWQSWGITPDALLGHSVGEYVAACLAGVFSFEDALGLVAARGKLIAELAPGSMVAVPLAEEELRPRLGAELSIAAVNAPRLCVVSGPSDAIEAFRQVCTKDGIECRSLHTSHAFHSSMMDPALDAFRDHVRKVKLAPPQIPIVSNVTGNWLTAAMATDAEYWVRHVREAVRFADGLAALEASGRTVLLEVGPGHVLTTFARQLTPAATALSSLAPADAPRDAVEVALTTLGRLWLAGCRVDWQAFHAREERSRVPLPTYPFERQRLWPDRPLLGGGVRLDAPSEHRDSGKRADVGAWFYAPTWKRSLYSSPREAFEGPTRWLVFGDEVGIADELVPRLGPSVILVRPGDEFAAVDGGFTVRRGVPEDLAALFEALGAERAPDAVVDLSTLGAEGGDALAEQLARFFFAPLELLRALGRIERPIRATFVTSGVYDVSGEEKVWPERSVLLGPCTVAPQEHPHLMCRHVDVIVSPERRAAIGEELARELTAKSPDARVALRGSQRWTPAYDPLRIDAEAKGRACVREGGVYLLTGGLGRVGLALARELASARAKLVLVGRSADTDAHRTAIRALEEAGAEVLAVRADAANPDEMRAAVSVAIERFGALHGVVYAAGVSGDADPTLTTIAELDCEHCDAQFHAKVRGVLALDQALGDRDLDFVLLTSSLATILGGVGFAAYAAANLFLDAFAQQKCAQRRSARWISVDWDAWMPAGIEGAERESSAAAFGSELAKLAIRTHEGADAFVRVLSLPDPVRVVVSTGDLEPRLAKWVNTLPGGAGGPAGVASGVRQPRPKLANAYARPTNEVEHAIAEIWEEILGFEEVGVHDDFFELGGHSLLATQLISRVRKRFHVDLPIRTFVDAPTVAGLAIAILHNQASQVAPAKLDELLAQLHELGDDEVASLLAQGTC